MTPEIYGDDPIRYLDRARPVSNLHPHIYYRNGWWRVSPCKTKNPILVRLFNVAHQYVARLNNKRRP